MEYEEKKSLLRWIDTASNAELQDKIMYLQSFGHLLIEESAIEDWKWMTRNIVSEIRARRELANTASNRLPEP